MVLFSFFGCNNSNKHLVDVSEVSVNFDIKRFDIDFYTSSKNKLPALKQKYPYLFPVSMTDSISLLKINDKDEQELFNETQKVFKDFSEPKKQLTKLFKHVKYYNSNFNSPDVVTLLTNIDYDSRVIYADSLLLISLDVFLGKEHPFYADYPKYIKENNSKEHLIVAVANAIIDKQMPPSIDRSFLGKIIYEGKKMYLLDRYLPTISDKEKMGYEQQKLAWAQFNEEDIWRYFVDRELLFSTDTKLYKRFIEVAPFSKFYLEHDTLSPGRIGVWIGWQIVRSYMSHNTVSLQELLKINSIELLNKSKYKPKK